MPLNLFHHSKKEKDASQQPSKSPFSSTRRHRNQSGSSNTSSHSSPVPDEDKNVSSASSVATNESKEKEKKLSLFSTKSSSSFLDLKRSQTESKHNEPSRKHSESISLGSIKPGAKRASTFEVSTGGQITTNFGALTHAPGKINLMGHSAKHNNNNDGTCVNTARPFIKPPDVHCPVIIAPKALPSIDSAPVMKKKLPTYNPYGISSNSFHQTSSLSTRHTRNNTSRSAANTSSSVYDEEKVEVLPLPLDDPNDHLPERLHQNSDELYPTFSLPELDSNKNRKLGDGASATVRTIVSVKDKKLYALKKFTLFKHEKPADFYVRCAKEFIIAKTLSSYPHIVTTYSLVKVPTIHEMSRGWGFILEFCKNGDLFGLITKSGWKSTSNEEKFCLYKQVCLGIKFIHDNDIAHRDIKPENVLLNERGIVKLTDFGVSCNGHKIPGDFDSPINLSTSFVGSPPYAPPEVMYFKSWNKKLKDDPNLPRYDPFKMDCWSLGMLLFCMIYQGTPFQEALAADSQYRDYTTAYDRFVSKNPGFKKLGNRSIKGPGVEYKYGIGFKDSGASRVAWRFCDPNPKTRYTLEDLFNDNWFLNLEMCHDEWDEEELIHKMADEKYTTSAMILEEIEENEKRIKKKPVEVESDLTVDKNDPECINGASAPKSLPSMLLVDTERKISNSRSLDSPSPQAQLSSTLASSELFPVEEDKDKEEDGESFQDAEESNGTIEDINTLPNEEAVSVSQEYTNEELISKLEEESTKETKEKTAKAETSGLPSIDNSKNDQIDDDVDIIQLLTHQDNPIAGTDIFLTDLPMDHDKFCKGKIRKHHHTNVSDITINALGKGMQSPYGGISYNGGYSPLNTGRLYSKV